MRRIEKKYRKGYEKGFSGLNDVSGRSGGGRFGLWFGLQKY